MIFVLVGLAILLAPDSVLTSLDWESRWGQFFAAALRIGFGVLIIGAASSTRYPNGMRALGAAVALSGLAHALMPGDAWIDLLRWLSDEGQTLYRLGGAAGGMLAGGFLIQATKPEDTTA